MRHYYATSNQLTKCVQIDSHPNPDGKSKHTHTLTYVAIGSPKELGPRYILKNSIDDILILFSFVYK